MILEKCLAKTFGSYCALHAGLTSYILTDLTGCPSILR
jgi:hypothetical protein